MNNMQHISKLKDAHKGEDIYVIASGKSLDYYDTSFFEGKVTIGVNQIYKKMKCDYIIKKEMFIQEAADSGAKVVVSQHAFGSLTSKFNEYSGESKEVYYFPHYHNNADIGPILLPDPSTHNLVVSASTLTSGLHLAAYMGAKNIIIVAHDCGTLDGEANFTNYTDSKTPTAPSPEYVNWLSRIEGQTCLVRAYLKKMYGVCILSLNPFVNFGLEGHQYRK